MTPTAPPARGADMVDDRPICECLICGRMHRSLGKPPWALTHDELCRLSRVFNQGANLNGNRDFRINEWLKRLIAAAALPEEQS